MICSKCNGGCCRRFPIDISGYDIIKISKTLMIDYPYFIDVIVVAEEELEKVQNNNIAIFKFTDDNCNDYYRFCLKKIDSKIFPGVLKCVFLQEWNDNLLKPPGGKNSITARCGIYECRPLTCANFPVKFDLSGNFLYITNPYKDAKKIGHPGLELCPRDVKNEDFRPFADSIIKSLTLYHYEEKFFKDLSEYWNSEPKPYSEFYQFIEKVYNNRVSSDAT